MKTLKIYFTSDMHGFVYPTDYTNNDDKHLGMLNVINSFTKDENTLIIDGGDTIQGSPFTTFISKKDFQVHPIGKVLNQGKYFVTGAFKSTLCSSSNCLSINPVVNF